MTDRFARLRRLTPRLGVSLAMVCCLLPSLAFARKPAKEAPAKASASTSEEAKRVRRAAIEAKLPTAPPPPTLDWKAGPYLETTPPLLAAIEPEKSAPGPILLLLVDAFRPDHFSTFGYPRDTTPALTAFAKEGLSFNRFYVNAPWTRPSTTSILTGLTPTRHRTQCEQHKLASSFVTLAEALNEGGYATAGVVGNGNGSSIAGLEQGFSFYKDTHFFKGLPNADRVLGLGGDWLEKRGNKARSFLFTFAVDPHDPYHGPTPEAEARYLWKGHPAFLRTPRWEYPKGKEPSPGVRRATIAVYDSALRYTDAALGRLFARLKKNGLWDRATIIITSDHGEGFGEHHFYKHAHHFWEEVERVPLLIRSPRLPKSAQGHSSNILASSVDLFPTILDLAGIDPSRYHRPGSSLMALLKAPPAKDRIIHSDYNCFGIHRSMMIQDGIKIVLQKPANEAAFMATVRRKDLLPSVIFDHEELKAFDLSKDPKERHNLVPGRDPKRAPEAIKAMLKTLRRYIAEQPGGESEAREMDPATEANLRALGYIQ